MEGCELESQVSNLGGLSLLPMQLRVQLRGWLCALIMGQGKALHDSQLSLQGLSLWIQDLPIQTLSSLMKTRLWPGRTPVGAQKTPAAFWALRASHQGAVTGRWRSGMETEASGLWGSVGKMWTGTAGMQNPQIRGSGL